MPTTANGRRALTSGFQHDPAITQTVMLERITDRALLALANMLTPGYLTRGSVQRDKTRKQREQDQAIFQALTQLMVNDLRITTEEGTTETAVRFALERLGVERGVILQRDDDPRFRSARPYGPWTLWDVMSEERKDREWPIRFMARGPRPAAGTEV
jgi:hypothetical protein